MVGIDKSKATHCNTASPFFLCTTQNVVFCINGSGRCCPIHLSFLLSFTHQPTVTITHCRGTQPRKGWTMIQAVHPLSQVIFRNQRFRIIHLIPCIDFLSLVLTFPCIGIFDDIQHIVDKGIPSLYRAIWICPVTP